MEQEKEVEKERKAKVARGQDFFCVSSSFLQIDGIFLRSYLRRCSASILHIDNRVRVSHGGILEIVVMLNVGCGEWKKNEQNS